MAHRTEAAMGLGLLAFLVVVRVGLVVGFVVLAGGLVIESGGAFWAWCVAVCFGGVAAASAVKFVVAGLRFLGVYEVDPGEAELVA